MLKTDKKKGSGGVPAGKGWADVAPGAPRLQLAAIGLEAEFAVIVDNEQRSPEDVFGDPRAFIRGHLVHRIGTSYHLPTGGAVYFDTGVIELATPVIEIEKSCAARAGRSLWESILFVRGELDAWERRTGREVRLVGFSAHYNISFEIPREQQGHSRTVEKLAYLLAHILPAPVMMLAANKRSTGIGVRPRGDRIEITADFTPSAALMIATAALITGVVREVMKWPSFDIDMLERESLPVIEDFRPMKHTSRKGWLARYDCYPRNPFVVPPDEPIWRVRSGLGRLFDEEVERLSLRQIAQDVLSRFRVGIRRIAEPYTQRLIERVISGQAPSLLDLEDRPEEYQDVGRLCVWDNLFPEKVISRSRYEQVLIRAIAGRTLWMDGAIYKPVGLKGWSEVVFHRQGDGARHVIPIDYLLQHLDRWK